MTTLRLAALSLRDRRKRILTLLAFAGLFLAAALVGRLLAADADGHVNADQLLAVGGYTAVSALLLLGWLLGRFPLIATLVLLAGLVSRDRAEGYARLYAVRPTSPLRIYGARFAVLAAIAFAACAILMPAFDLLMLGTWAGPATLVLILSHVLVFGGLVALLSVWTRADAWIALLLAVAALVWDGFRTAGALTDVPAGVRDVITFVLPPQAALFRLEEAFGDLAPIPWDAFLYSAGYGLTMLALAGVALYSREL